jgi:hypothetical protein
MLPRGGLFIIDYLLKTATTISPTTATTVNDV